MATWSTKTKSQINRQNIRQDEDIYPDRQATPDADGNFPIRTNAATVNRLSESDVPKTTHDVSRSEKWKHGQRLYGTFAKDHPGLKNYRRDINKAYGQEKNYKPFYVDTNKSVGDQLKDQNR